MSTVIKVEELSKQYRLGVVGSGTFKEDVIKWLAKIRGRNNPYALLGDENIGSKKSVSDFVWSLKEVNFEVNQGDVLGIIGRNGAGKSTLLKILSKVTAPTTGSIKAKGRIASLLEVGTGFHPELTGRENIYLNGAILGMRKSEIKSKMDEIITFAGVERYIDTPVKRYSSGMYVRLAFAVAAHLENEILIIDEVLAVGDAEFQKKCLGKMSEVSKGEGRTVLFVSHNMPSISTLCNRAILLKNGRIETDSSVSNCISDYFGNFDKTGVLEKEIYYKDIFKLNLINLKNTLDEDSSTSENTSILFDNKEIQLNVDFSLNDFSVSSYHITFHLYNENGEGLFSFSHKGIQLKNGDNILKFKFPKLFFQSGTFYLHFFFIKDRSEAVIYEPDILCFRVIDGVRDLGSYMGREPGFIRPNIECSIN